MGSTPILDYAIEEAGCDDCELLARLRNPSWVFTIADLAIMGPILAKDSAK